MIPHSNTSRTAPARRIRIVLVGDARLVREGLRCMLEAEGDVEIVGEAASGEDAVAVVAQHQPDIVIMDAWSRGDGLAATRRITESAPQTRVVVLTVRDDSEVLVRTRQAGASGVLLKDSTGADLLRTVRAIHRGEQVLDPAAGWKVLDHLVRLVQNDQAAGANGALTAREREVLQLLTEGRSNREIAERLFITANTLKTHIRHIQQKLGTQDRLQTVAYALRHGLVE